MHTRGVGVWLNAISVSEFGGDATLRPLCPKKTAPVPIINRVGWAPRPVWTRGDILPPPEFKPRTVQSVARSGTDFVVLAPSRMNTSSNNEMYTKYNTLLQASRSQWPRGLRRGSATARLLGLRGEDVCLFVLCVIR